MAANGFDPDTEDWRADLACTAACCYCEQRYQRSASNSPVHDAGGCQTLGLTHVLHGWS